MINKNSFTNALLFSVFVSLFCSCTKKEDKVEPLAKTPEQQTPVTILPDSVIALDVQINKIIDHKAYKASADKSLFLMKYDNVKLISMDSTIDKSNKKEIYYYGEFLNITKNRVTVSDTVFVWERISQTKPVGWNVGFCIGEVCYPPTTIKGEFYLGKKSFSIFDFVFSALDDKEYATFFGEGVLTAEYVIYRKGTKREDGVKFSVKLTAK